MAGYKFGDEEKDDEVAVALRRALKKYFEGNPPTSDDGSYKTKKSDKNVFMESVKKNYPKMDARLNKLRASMAKNSDKSTSSPVKMKVANAITKKKAKPAPSMPKMFRDKKSEAAASAKASNFTGGGPQVKVAAALRKRLTGR